MKYPGPWVTLQLSFPVHLPISSVPLTFVCYCLLLFFVVVVVVIVVVVAVILFVGLFVCRSGKGRGVVSLEYSV